VLGKFGVLSLLLGGDPWGVTTSNCITVDTDFKMVAALQVLSALGDEDGDPSVEMSDDSEAGVLTHTQSSNAKRPRRVEESGKTVLHHG